MKVIMGMAQEDLVLFLLDLLHYLQWLVSELSLQKKHLIGLEKLIKKQVKK